MSKNLPYNRTDRLADVITRIVSEALITELSDPRLEGVSVTYVRVTKDMRLARINYHISNADEERKLLAEKGLKSAKSYLKRKIAGEISLKFMPEIDFHYDEAFDASERIEDLLKGLKE